MASSSDEAILEHASLGKRVIITADLDYPRLLALEQTDGPGLILFRNGDYSERESLERLKTALDAIPEEDLPHSIIVIEKSRIRQRRLPVQNTDGFIFVRGQRKWPTGGRWCWESNGWTGTEIQPRRHKGTKHTNKDIKNTFVSLCLRGCFLLVDSRGGWNYLRRTGKLRCENAVALPRGRSG